MKITSRPTVEEHQIGSGAFTVRMDLDELEYLAALLYVTRLGKARYEHAAYKLITKLEDEFGDDFLANSAAAVNLRVSRIDEHDTIIDELEACEFILEVG